MKNMGRQFLVKPGSRVKLARLKTDETGGIRKKSEALALMKENIRRLDGLQYLLYAEGRRSVLVVLQAMDAGGKDGAIRHVMAGLNPQGCRVTSFKKPSREELAHDFLWRVHRAVPRRGEIGIFNRSHYEDVLVVRVHELVPRTVWKKRYRQINDFERSLHENGVHILKFFLHISRSEQTKRLRARLEDPNKHWKISEEDFSERKLWNDYVEAYEEALSRCSATWAPWFIIPADRKWFRNLAISQIVADELARLKMKFPEPKLDISKFRL